MSFIEINTEGEGKLFVNPSSIDYVKLDLLTQIDYTGKPNKQYGVSICTSGMAHSVIRNVDEATAHFVYTNLTIMITNHADV